MTQDTVSLPADPNPLVSWWSALTESSRVIRMGGVLLAAMVAGLMLLSTRAVLVVGAYPRFAGGGLEKVVLVGLTAVLFSQLGYVLLVSAATRVFDPDAVRGFRESLAVVLWASVPIALAWLFQGLVAWLKGAPLAVASASDVLDAVRQVIALRSHLGAFVDGGSRLSRGLLQTVDFFWIWHFVLLSQSVRERRRFARGRALGLVALAVLTVLLGQLVQLAVLDNYGSFVTWSD
jgi:hypothetical protein